MFATLAVLACTASAGADTPKTSAATSVQGAAAATTSAAPTTTATATSAPADATAQQGIAVGAELGEPTSATVGWFHDKLAVLGAVGTGTVAGLGIQIHADVQMDVHRLQPNIPIRVGLGARFYHHGYQPQSIDEIPHEHYGIRVPVAIAYEKKAMQLYAEVSPGVDFKRTNACALTNGAYSICPHQQQNPLFVQLVVGVRFFISH
jgi:hypothetical protein